MIEVVEDRLVQEFIAHAAVEGLTVAVCIGLPPFRLASKPLSGKGGAMKCQATLADWVQASMAFKVNSVPWSLKIISGLPRRAMMASSSRATRRPEIDVSGIAARHSFVTSSMTFRMRKRRPEPNWSWTKSSDQRAFGLASTRSGARVPVARLRPRLRRTDRPLPDRDAESSSGSPRALHGAEAHETPVAEPALLGSQLTQALPQSRVIGRRDR